MVQSPHLIPYHGIAEACQITGLSQHFLRKGCQAGTIPHTKSGKKYLINVPALMETLHLQETLPTKGA